MLLNVLISGNTIPVDVPDIMLTEAQEFFKKMDKDMDKGWQMSFTWVDNPNPVQRCQIAADKLYGAHETENQNLMMMMAGYILYKLPGITEVYVSTNGDMNETEVVIPSPGT